MPFRLTVNGTTEELDLPADMPLLWVLRDVLDLTGTKYGCGVAACGSCTVHVNGRAVRSCSLRLEDVDGPVTTIEGLGDADNLAPLQLAWITHQAAQCGYCQSGQIMQAAALLADNPDPSDAEIDTAMEDIMCRCGSYSQIRAAIRDAAGAMRGG